MEKNKVENGYGRQIALAAFLAFQVASLSAHADKFPAETVGLGPETGYEQVVTSSETCRSGKDVVMHGLDSEERKDQYTFLHTCDGQIVGWVERVGRGSQLYSFGNLAEKNVYYQMGLNVARKSSPPGLQALDMLNIESCGTDRDDELAKDPRAKASRDMKGDYEKLSDIIAHDRRFKIQLFFNEWIFSGKCIGKIEVLD